MRDKNQTEEYLGMGFALMPSGKPNHYKWYVNKFRKGSVRDDTWNRGACHHSCCRSRKPYCHLVGCSNRIELPDCDDLSDLRDIC